MKEKAAKYRPKISDWGLRDKRYLLFVGGLNKCEGAHYLIEAFKQLEDTAKTPNNFKLAIVSSEKENDDEDYVKYLRLISENRDNVIFFCARKRSSIKQLFLHAYLYVQPSESDMDESALTEAMGCGLAPLVSDTETNMDLVGNDGFSFAKKSVPELRDRLAYLLNRSEEVSAMSEQIKKRMKKQLEKAVVISKEECVSEKIISDNKKWPWKLRKLMKKF